MSDGQPSGLDLQVRPATRRDLLQILAVESECFGFEAYTLREFQSYFRTRSSIFLVAQSGDALAGYVVGVLDRRFRQPTARLDSLALLPSYRRRGIGARLLAKFEELAQVRGCQAVSLQVSVRNETARRLYESFGYEPTEVLQHYYGKHSHALQMTRNFT